MNEDACLQETSLTVKKQTEASDASASKDFKIGDIVNKLINSAGNHGYINSTPELPTNSEYKRNWRLM